MSVKKKKVKKSRKTKKPVLIYDGLEKLVLLIGLIFFNLVFIAWLFFGISGILIGFIAASVALVVAGMSVTVIGIVYPFVQYSWVMEYVALGGISGFALIFIGIALICFGLSWAIINYHLVRAFAKTVAWWFALNYRIFKK